MSGTIRFLSGLSALISTLAFAAVVPVRAQDSSLDSAAARMAAAIAHSGENSVVVFDFNGPDGKQTALGQKLAEDFSHALSVTPGGPRVEDGRHIAEAVSRGGYAPVIAHVSAYDPELAIELKVDAYVDGTVSVVGKSLIVSAKSRGSRDWSKKSTFSFSVPLTEELSDLLAITLVEAPIPPYLDPDDNGFSPAKCLRCPNADYTREAESAKTEGTVILEAVIGEDGRIGNIRVIKPLPHGLTESSIDTVRRWRLSPAKGPDGKPTTVRQVIMLTFRL